MVENKLQSKILFSFQNLKKYCEKEKFKGWDPYDGLNSKIFQMLPFKHWDLARLIWIQSFKRNPINLRKIFLVPKQYNSKGLGLFLLGYCNLYRLSLNSKLFEKEKDKFLAIIHELSNLIIEKRNKNYSGACWGYNFDWQARRLFLFPTNTPTVVATTFCIEALFEAYELTKVEEYKSVALSAAKFICEDLNRAKHNSGFIFSYSPLNGNNTVFNASLLGAKSLSLCYKYDPKPEYKTLAQQTIRAICESQARDGSWVYGLLPIQKWIDSFHTGYNLDAISTYQTITNDYQFNEYLEKGFSYYIENFFHNNGKPKYYNNKTYPIDIHCPGQLFVTLSKLKKFKQNIVLADKVFNWSIDNMQSSKGFFYYQVKRYLSSKISYMRWSNAFMFNSMSFYLTEKLDQ